MENKLTIKDRTIMIMELLLQSIIDTNVLILKDNSITVKTIKNAIAANSKITARIIARMSNFINSDEIGIVLSREEFSVADVVEVMDMYHKDEDEIVNLLNELLKELRNKK